MQLSKFVYEILAYITSRNSKFFAVNWRQFRSVGIVEILSFDRSFGLCGVGWGLLRVSLLGSPSVSRFFLSDISGVVRLLIAVCGILASILKLGKFVARLHFFGRPDFRIRTGVVWIVALFFRRILFRDRIPFPMWVSSSKRDMRASVFVCWSWRTNLNSNFWGSPG